MKGNCGQWIINAFKSIFRKFRNMNNLKKYFNLLGSLEKYFFFIEHKSSQNKFDFFYLKRKKKIVLNSFFLHFQLFQT